MRKPYLNLSLPFLVAIALCTPSGAGAQDASPFAKVVAGAPTVPTPRKTDIYGEAPMGPPAASYFPLLPYESDSDAMPQMLPVASNHALDGDHAKITRAIIVIHDVTRDAGSVLALLTTLAGAGGENTLIIAPQFLLESDIAHFAGALPNDGHDIPTWPMGAWEEGGDSTPRPPQKGISSFTAIDMLLLFLGEKTAFPDLKDIVIAGHGTGGDFVLRYAAAGQAPDLLAPQGIDVRYVAANPSSFVYFTPMRPQGTKPGFAALDASKCNDFDDYKYGLNHLNAYAQRTGANAIQLRYPSRRVIYLAGEKVASDDHYPDGSCAAQLQGRDRLARMANYDTYINTAFGDELNKMQKFATVPKAGYDPAAMFGSRCGMSALFGDGECAPPPLRGTEIPQ